MVIAVNDSDRYVECLVHYRITRSRFSDIGLAARVLEYALASERLSISFGTVDNVCLTCISGNLSA